MGFMRKARPVIAVFALALLIAACGGQSAEEQLLEEILENSGEDIGDIDIDTGGGDGDFSISIEGEGDGEGFTMTGSGDDENFEITVEGDDGETMTFGGGDIPDGLTVPVPDGGEVTMSLTSDQDISVALQYPENAYDQLVAFYDSNLDVSSDSVDRYESTMSTEQGTIRSVNWNESNYGWTVNVSDCFGGVTGELDSICVTIFESPGE
jgi:hypothetical protein